MCTFGRLCFQLLWYFLVGSESYVNSGHLEGPVSGSSGPDTTAHVGALCYLKA